MDIIHAMNVIIPSKCDDDIYISYALQCHMMISLFQIPYLYSLHETAFYIHNHHQSINFNKVNTISINQSTFTSSINQL